MRCTNFKKFNEKYLLMDEREVYKMYRILRSLSIYMKKTSVEQRKKIFGTDCYNNMNLKAVESLIREIDRAENFKEGMLFSGWLQQQSEGVVQ